ncbi:NAD(P)-dependent oxidoreductase [Micromonospora sp. NPDC005161]
MVDRPTIGLVGLGNMGASVAARLVETYHVLGYDPTPSAAVRALAEDGNLELVAHQTDVAAADTVILSLPTPAISHAAVAAIAPLMPGGTIIETSTVLPSDMQAEAALTSPHGIRLVDAAILAGTGPMVSGKAALLVGGSVEDVAAARLALERFAADIQVLGPLGAGMAAKVINNAVAHAVMVVLAEAAALAAANGIPRGRIADLLSSVDGGLIRPLEHRYKERMLHGDFEGGMPTDAARKDSTLALALAQDGHVPLFGIHSAHTVYELASAAKLDKLDYAAITTLWETWTGRPMRDGD